jgi:sigma-B regulation protein RsbU (phosphoserine phosphatase)
MNPAVATIGETYRPQLLERRARLQSAAAAVPADYLNQLLAEVDSALGRIDTGTFGFCETCHDPIEPDRLESNPLVRFCLDHLSRAEMSQHQQDLDLATEIQSRLLPPRELGTECWDTHFRYQPVAAVGGDYCDLMTLRDGRSLFFAVGDVAGKGVAASLLMTHLSAIFRSLVSLDLPLSDIVTRANRLFCESTAPAHYATLVCGRATEHGIELCNAGHCRPLVLQRDATQQLDSTGLPLGLFCGSQYGVKKISFGPGESLALYSDGITEAQEPDGEEYQEDRLIQALRAGYDLGVGAMADGVLQDVARFRRTRPPADDITLLILRRR